ncbi:MAG: thioredoxin-disulfide reductase [bacterium]|nr:thioredoxin-disulfide reductase [bacterium]
MVREVIVLGSGPAGLTAAIYLARANLKPLVIAGNQPGGQLMITTEVDNFPGFPEGIMGPELMKRMTDQALRFESEIINSNVTKVDFTRKDNDSLKFWVGDAIFESKACILATGASAIWLGLESEQRLRGHGVSACATCDGFFFRGKDIAVVGGGDTAMEEAIFLTRFANTVTVIHRRDTLRASKIMQDKAFNNPKIKFLWNCVVEEVLGEKVMSGLKIKNIISGEISNIDYQGLFLAIGHKPNTDVLKDSGLLFDTNGYLVNERETWTKIDGVFLAGDVSDSVYRQAIMAAGVGCRAALDVESWLGEARTQRNW